MKDKCLQNGMTLFVITIISSASLGIMDGLTKEPKAAAEKAGIHKDTGLHRTGLEKYLEVILPEVKDWIHNKAIGGIP